MDSSNSPVFFDNVSDRVIDDLKMTLSSGNKVDIVAANFFLYAHQLLKKELEHNDELNFLFIGEVFTNEQALGLASILRRL